MKEIIGSKLIGIISALAGTALITVTGLVREGIVVESYDAIATENQYTILVYMNGSDLESDYGAASADLAEMEEALNSLEIEADNVRIVVEAGGAISWEYEAMEEVDYGRFCLTSAGISDFTELEIRNMGEADTLADFLNYGMESYPAEHYILVFWNHGSGSICGFGSDSNYEDDALTLSEMSTAFELADMPSTFELISFDACLMGTIETVATLSDYTNYLIASAELEPEQGYDYKWLEIFAEIDENILEITDIGHEILETYIAYYEDEEYALSLALIDMSKYEDFEQVISSLIEPLSTDEKWYQDLGEIRDSMVGFGSDSGLDIADAIDFMAVLNAFGEYTEDEVLLEQLNEAYSALVVEVVSTGYAQGISGLSIYLPSGSNEELVNEILIYEEIGFSEEYKEFAVQYTEFLTSEYEMEWTELYWEESAEEIVVTVSEEVVDSIVSAYLVTFIVTDAGENIYLISSDSDVSIYNNGTLKATSENEFWGLQGQYLCMIEVVNTQSYTEYMVPILYNGEQCNMMIEFTMEYPNGNIAEIVPVETSKQKYSIQEGDIIVPLYPVEEIVNADMNAAIEDFYMGDTILIKNLEAGDAELELLEIKEALLYGFMIKDNRQQITYVINLENEVAE